MVDSPESEVSSPSREAVIAWSVGILALIAALTAISVARLFLMPVVLAFLLALVFSPLCRFWRRRGMPEWLSAAIIVFGLIVGILTITASLAYPVTQWMDDAPSIMREVERKMKGLTGMAQAVAEAGERVQDATETATNGGGGDEPVEVVVQESGPLTTVAFQAPLIAAQTVFVLILLYFILASGTHFYDRLVKVMPTFADKKRALAIAYDIEKEVSRYLFAITAINAGLGVAVAVAFTLLGMPSPIAFGLMVFALNFMPFIGAMIGTVISFAVALVVMDTAGSAFFVAFVFFSLTSIEGQIITPMLVGRHLQLNTVVILLSVAFWAWLWSIMGMLMAVPLLVTLRVLCRHVPQLEGLGHFLSAKDADT